MSCILNIETSTSVCSVALSMDGEVLFAKASFDGPSHAALLGVFVEEALSVLKKKGKNCLYCAMLDARRMEVYAAIYDASLKPVRETKADIVEAGTYASYLEKGKVCFFGNGASKCKSVITSPNAIIIQDIHPLAVNMIPLSEQAFAAGKFEDTAYFEPFYLKEFQATVAKNKVLLAR